MTGALVRMPILRDRWKRRAIFLGMTLLCTALALFPQRYRAITSLTPTDPTSLGLSGTLGQLGAVNSVFGNQTAVEIALKIAQSPYVSDQVIDRLDLTKRLGRSRLETERWLHRKVDLRVMRGGIVQIETTLEDADLGRQIVGAYGNAIRAQLAGVARTQTQYKRKILLNLVSDASARLTRAQSAYDTFRLRTHYSEPERALAATGARIPLLEGQIKGKEGELAAARRFATDRNFSVQRIVAELEALRSQLAQAKSSSSDAADAIGPLVRESTEAERLQRELDISLALYQSYKRFLEGTSVEDLTSTANIRVLEPAYLDPERQYNMAFVGLAVLMALLGLALEFYTLRPPVEGRGQ